MSKRVNFIIELVGSILLILFFGLVIADISLDVLDHTNNIYCNYAVAKGDYSDNFFDRMQCSVDFLEKVLEDEKN